MNESVKHIVQPLLLDGEILTVEEVTKLTSQFPFLFPESYLDVIRYINGREGEIGSDSWLCLFPLQELSEVNHDYAILMDDIPDYFLIGKDAADTGYAFHKFNKTYHAFGLMSNFKTDPIIFCGNTLLEFVEYLYNE